MRDPRLFRESYRRATDEYFRSVVTVDLPGDAGRLTVASLQALRKAVRSPLEALLGVRLVEALARRQTVGWDPRSGGLRPSLRECRLVTFCCNFRVDRFSFDFWIQADRASEIDRRPAQVTLIECDGAAWHWGRQLDRDRRKDEFAADLDWALFRLPAKRILRNPSGCADELVNYALDGYVRTSGVLND